MEKKEIIDWLDGLIAAAENVKATEVQGDLDNRTRIAYLLGYIKSADFLKQLLTPSLCSTLRCFSAPSSPFSSC